MNIRKLRIFVTGKKMPEDIIVEDIEKNKRVVYGRQAYNAQMPGFLRTPTKDWDVYARNPKAVAKKIVGTLTKEFGDKFKVVPAIHSGTWRVIKTNGKKEVLADYTYIPKKLSLVKVNDIRYEHISAIEKRKKEILTLKGAAFRRGKDKYDLSKLELAKKLI